MLLLTMTVVVSNPALSQRLPGAGNIGPPSPPPLFP